MISTKMPAAVTSSHNKSNNHGSSSSNQMKASKPIPIKTSNLNNNNGNGSSSGPGNGNNAASAYPSPVSPSTLSACSSSSSPSQVLSTYQLPYAFTQKYKMGEELGYGGFGFVYSVQRISDGKQLACKFIYKSKIAATSWTVDDVLGKCPMEVAVLKNVKHENIIEYVDYFDDDSFCYCFTRMHGTQWLDDSKVLDHPDNNQTPPSPSRRSMDLFECIEKYEFFAEPLARHIFSQIIRGVAYLHSLGLVHRDIKDENILIDDTFHVKIIDFGSAAFFNKIGGPLFNVFLGTKQYASPEIHLKNQYRGPEAEIWALGCCLYIILNGAVPFGSSNQVIHSKYTLPGRPLSPHCLHLLDRMLDKNPATRITIAEIQTHSWFKMRE